MIGCRSRSPRTEAISRFPPFPTIMNEPVYVLSSPFLYQVVGAVNLRIDRRITPTVGGSRSGSWEPDTVSGPSFLCSGSSTKVLTYSLPEFSLFRLPRPEIMAKVRLTGHTTRYACRVKTTSVFCLNLTRPGPAGNQRPAMPVLSGHLRLSTFYLAGKKMILPKIV